ncbi:SHOCT domain-containing protein [Eubacterium pyruvativorans]|uniref:SHOCT domain-containing protein n=1 Tax=Eubacterium pyruvativorans TaxID=155865 RepID=UPI0015693E01|nr:SHOCT domain-containing protein [Eubacterium pyruvativorans]
MTTEEMKNDARYVLAMDMAKNLLETGAISNEEYQHFETKMIEKYRPLLGVLFSDTSC